MDICARFFNPEFFHWQAADDRLQWVGHWIGWGSLINDRLSILPWLLLVLLVISVICKSRSRTTISLLSAITIIVFTILSLVIACLKKHNLPDAIGFAENEVGRYYYPFFTAWFIGVAAVWFNDGKNEPQQALQPEKNSPELTPQKPKRRG